jgi:hypothetical protein
MHEVDNGRNPPSAFPPVSACSVVQNLSLVHGRKVFRRGAESAEEEFEER